MISITEPQTDLLSKKIYEIYGFSMMHYKTSFVQNALEKFAHDHKIKSFNILMGLFYVDEILFNNFKKKLFIGFSEMFRDPDVFYGIKELIKIKYQHSDRIKIWCAGCASGQEVYSLAILLSDLGLYDRALIYATDSDDKALKLAEYGGYDNSLAMSYAQNYYLSGGVGRFSDYFDTSFSEFRIKKQYKKNIKFAKHDLVDNNFLDEFDLIFARNILIYLKEFAQKLILSKISTSLADGGYFIIGKNETLQQCTNNKIFIESGYSHNIFKFDN